MDALSHSIAGILMGLVGCLPWPLILFFAILGGLPDFVGWLEKITKHNPNAWEWYNKAHNDWWWLFILPPYGLHVLLDKWTHGEGKRWWKHDERLWAEILNWAIILIVFTLKIYYI